MRIAIITIIIYLIITSLLSTYYCLKKDTSHKIAYQDKEVYDIALFFTNLSLIILLLKIPLVVNKIGKLAFICGILLMIDFSFFVIYISIALSSIAAEIGYNLGYFPIAFIFFFISFNFISFIMMIFGFFIGVTIALIIKYLINYLYLFIKKKSHRKYIDTINKN